LVKNLLLIIYIPKSAENNLLSFGRLIIFLFIGDKITAQSKKMGIIKEKLQGGNKIE